MPYLAHFGLKDHPFTLTPNIDYYFPTQDNANIIASLDFALRRDTGIIKIVGPIGTGKTLLCRLLIHKLVETDRVAYINAPQADSGAMLRTVCEEFGISVAPDDASLYSALNRFLLATHEEGKLAVVVVDEAHHLGEPGLEAVRLMSNLETDKRKLLQIVLFGQTELDQLLARPGLRQLAQRIVFSFDTKPMTILESRRYIGHRLRVSRQDGVDYAIFTDPALTLIARRSGGIPRVLNILADKSLLSAFAAGSPLVQVAHVREAAADSPALIQGGGWRSELRQLGGARIALVAALALAIILSLAGLSLRYGHPPADAPGPPIAAAPAVPAPSVADPVAPVAPPPAPPRKPAARHRPAAKPITPPPATGAGGSAADDPQR